MDAVYVVLMRRWGYIEGHTYLLGAYDTLDSAKECAELEKSDRGGKYEYQIFSAKYGSMCVVADTCGDQKPLYESACSDALEVPAIPEPGRIDSMCLRYDHGFGLRSEREKEGTRITMRQLYEEATGQGFFRT